MILPSAFFSHFYEKSPFTSFFLFASFFTLCIFFMSFLFIKLFDDGPGRTISLLTCASDNLISLSYSMAAFRANLFGLFGDISSVSLHIHDKLRLNCVDFMGLIHLLSLSIYT